MTSMTFCENLPMKGNYYSRAEYGRAADRNGKQTVIEQTYPCADPEDAEMGRWGKGGFSLLLVLTGLVHQ